MKGSLQFLTVVSLLYSVVSTMRCASLQVQNIKSQENVVAIAHATNSAVAEYNTLLDTIHLLSPRRVDSTNVVYKTIIKTIVKSVYIKVPTPYPVAEIRPMPVKRDSPQSDVNYLPSMQEIMATGNK